ncbi:large subunit ribosomal protein L23 [Catalinimonas alkaloidigena]|uniref:Large ribosomal subunit protein uL23 n=1 Tax=Catalinimonas alkaloidigena TaxID=1075417 RepID=A0A1G9Q7J5_9BACT|nr:50S ribosomal protein L23 [Catalinimonas alkaloidigena]SDM06986.1 large subunit ribosomal protein L23 [Catalinimonas alkaloidigena]
MRSILIRPLVTEKFTKLNEKGVYGFEVNRDSDKLQIRHEIESMYNVRVKSVRTVNYQGKPKSRYTKAGVISGRTQNTKRAYVQLAEGEFIDFYENI